MDDETTSSSNDMNNNSTLMPIMHPIEEETSQLETTTTVNIASTPNKQRETNRPTRPNQEETIEDKCDKFKATVEFVGDYLEKVMSQMSPLGDAEQNKLTSNVLNLARSLIYFGFYSFRDLLKLSRILLEILDKDNTANTAQSSSDESDLLQDMNASNRSCGPSNSSNHPFHSNLVFDIKLDIIEIFEFILNVRLDYRLTYLLSVFKTYCDSNENEVDSATADDDECRNHHKEVVKKLLNESDRLFIEYPSEILNEEVATAQCDIMDFDGEGGKKFLKILLKLVEQDHPKLTSGALNLIFRRFSQIQETVNGLKQVIKQTFLFLKNEPK